MFSRQPSSVVLSISHAWSEEEGWDLLFYYNIYRLLLAMFLAALAYPLLIDNDHRLLLLPVILPTAGIAIVSLVTFANIIRRSPRLDLQTHLTFLLDVVLIWMLIYGEYLAAPSSVALYVTVAATAIVFRVRMSLVYAAFCAYLKLYTEYQGNVAEAFDPNNLYLSAVSVVGFFAISMVVGYIANKTSRAQLLADQQELALTDLGQVNRLVISQLEIGIVILDKTLDVKLINESALNLIGSAINRDRIEGVLARRIIRIMNSDVPSSFSIAIGSNILGISTVPLRSGLIMQIENQTTLSRRIQKTKLATVGRMASAIAHEIRNPLNAINHAAQLLQPATGEHQKNHRLLEQIRGDAQAIDGIVESVLQRSRAGQAEQRVISLSSWLKNFVVTFEKIHAADNVKLHRSGRRFDVYFDPIQLEQIVSTLCQCSLQYNQTVGATREITLHTDFDEIGSPYLDVLDFGLAIKPDDRELLFDPFHHSDEDFAGLGLFLVREFCAMNGAEVHYYNDYEKHGFRVSFLIQQGSVQH